MAMGGWKQRFLTLSLSVTIFTTNSNQYPREINLITPHETIVNYIEIIWKHNDSFDK